VGYPAGVSALLLRAKLKGELGSSAEAATDFHHAVSAARALLAQAPPESLDDAKELLARALIEWADDVAKRDRDGGIELIKEARELIAEDVDSERRLELQFLVRLRLGDLAPEGSPEALNLYREAHALALGRHVRHDSQSSLRALSVAQTRLGSHLLITQQPIKALAEFEAALELRQQAIAVFGVTRERLADLESVADRIAYVRRVIDVDGSSVPSSSR
jgi:hypothetical protein